MRGRVVVLTTVLVVLIFGWPTAPLATASAANVSVSIGSATIVANANAQVTMFFPVTLSQPSTTAVSVSYATQAGTAPSTWYRAASGTLTFPVNPLTGTTSVEKLAAIVVSPFSLPCITRAFSVHLSAPVGATLANQVGTGTIMSCATAGATRVNAGDMRLYGGAGGTNRAAYIPVTLSSAAPGPVVVHYVIAGVTAARPANFRAPILGTMTIAAGSVQTWAGITVVSGSVQNPPKSFVVKLTSATGAALGRSTGTVTIIPEPQALLFDDEFNGKALDLSKWQPNWLGATNATITKPVNSEELSCYDPHQVTEPGDGRLHLNAVRRSCHAANGVTYSMASGLVETRKHFTFTYGYLEARIWLPTGTSQTMNWPAFWAAGTGVWPATGELDVMEGLEGGDCFHFHSLSGGPGGCAPMAVPSGWHIFGARWAPGSVTYYYDGKQVGRITSGITNLPMYLILNQGIGIHDLPAGTVSLPSTMLVDYVRVSR